jgi:hypothetical protein
MPETDQRVSLPVMDRKALLERLAAAIGHCKQGKAQIARQTQIIAQLAALGADTAHAKEILASFEQTLSCHFADLQWILNALDETPR